MKPQAVALLTAVTPPRLPHLPDFVTVCFRCIQQLVEPGLRLDGLGAQALSFLGTPLVSHQTQVGTVQPMLCRRQFARGGVEVGAGVARPD